MVKSTSELVQEIMSEITPHIPRGETRLKDWMESSLAYFVSHAIDGRQSWVITLSGKDSLTASFIAWYAMAGLRKYGHDIRMTVVHNDTMVEDPVLHGIMVDLLHWFKHKANTCGLPVDVRLVQPPLERRPFYQIFVKGYPAPNRQFRYCTRSWKISPTNEELQGLSPDLLVLGVRRNESLDRDRRLDEQQRIRETDCTLGGSECGQDVLMKQESNFLPDTLRVAPIMHWTSTDEIWCVLREVAPALGWPTRDIEAAYPREDSRLGCWMCTLVTRNVSLEEKVESDPEYSKYQCLLDWREKYRVFSLDPRYRALKNYDEVEAVGSDGIRVLRGEISCLTYEARRELYQAWCECEDELGRELMDPESRERVEEELAKDIDLPQAFMQLIILRRKRAGMHQQKWAL